MSEIIKQFLIYLFPNFLLMSAMLYGWHKLLNRKINFKDPKLYITLIGVIVVSIINHISVEKFVRIILLTVILMLFIKYFQVFKS